MTRRKLCSGWRISGTLLVMATAGLDALTTAIGEEFPRATAVYLFGSRATGQATTTSDYDVAILASERLEPVARWHAQERLASITGASVDLVDLKTASTVFRAQIIHGGIVLLDRDPSERARFEMYALSDYARLNEERRGILEDIHARGTVHG